MRHRSDPFQADSDDIELLFAIQPHPPVNNSQIRKGSRANPGPKRVAAIFSFIRDAFFASHLFRIYVFLPCVSEGTENAMLYTPQSSPGRPPLPVDIEPSSSPLPLPSSSSSSASTSIQTDGKDSTTNKEGVTTRVFYERTNVQRHAAAAAQRRANEFFGRKTDAGSASVIGTGLLPTPPRSCGSGLGHEEQEDGEPPAKKRRCDEADDLVDTDIERERDLFLADDEEIRDTKLYHSSFVSSSSTASFLSVSSSSSSRTAVSARQPQVRDPLPTVPAVGTTRRAMMMSGAPRFANGNVRRYS
jgi:hypothetical protein